jgi:hypothetical protein
MYWQCPALFIPESGMAYRGIYSVHDTSDYSLFENIEDPAKRWHRMVEAYSGLALTYASDRLPAIAAIVERKMQLRQDDIYIAGMWTSSLLSISVGYLCLTSPMHGLHKPTLQHERGHPYKRKFNGLSDHSNHPSD